MCKLILISIFILNKNIIRLFQCHKIIYVIFFNLIFIQVVTSHSNYIYLKHNNFIFFSYKKINWHDYNYIFSVQNKYYLINVSYPFAHFTNVKNPNVIF